jgi:hypothetical protein
MRDRLTHLHRVLKPTGTLYLRCDPAASHYLKVAVDGLFGYERSLSEIIWKRSSAHSRRCALAARLGELDVERHRSRAPDIRPMSVQNDLDTRRRVELDRPAGWAPVAGRAPRTRDQASA